MVQEGVENGTIDSETPEKDLGRFTEKNNISIAVIDSEYNVVYTNVREKQMMVVQLFGYLYDKNHQEVLEKTDSYDICKSVDPQNNTEYLTMWGNFDNGDIFIMRSPLESIRSAVMIFNRFIGSCRRMCDSCECIACVVFLKKDHGADHGARNTFTEDGRSGF